ncbi:aminoglycoside adenylyltransferase domain-containing protein [Cohnella abietis]|uniref:Spectinomycin 9-adenylyltransferase n=1 Tax=Cohnella abietis TaxID=2507935 RepID=A0A3T1D640_9BACL|nr:aminoglycoside adenylyltransferase domain-containing protein [Cohnella abietis]BBI33547.1 streptomycin 3''-adenylyltransferase [Cohnella abietis]
MKQQVVLESVVALLKEELSQSLTGIYLHGSMAMGCFNPTQSDIDILVIVKGKQSIATYKKIANQLINIEDEQKVIKGFELSIVLEEYAVDFVYPTPFEFHYSSFHREKYKTDENYFCGGDNDPDLAAHFVVTYHRGIVLFGNPIKEVFKPIENRFYIDSIKSDVDGAIEGITGNPVYFILNLPRVLLYLRESVISSKREAGEWALNEVPTEYIQLITNCLAKYNNEPESMSVSEETLLSYANYMLKEIENVMGENDYV